MKRTHCLFVSASLLALVSGCSGSDSSKTDADYKQEVVAQMHDSLVTDIDSLLAAAKAVQSAAPSMGAWDATRDADAIAATKDAWRQARTAYEHTEGALAPLFPQIDSSIDARYEDLLADAPGMQDQDLFDGEGVTGLHAVERILWADSIPAHVVDFEKTLPGYQAARFPMTADEATAFKDKLCARMIADAQKLHDQWQPQVIDIGGAFKGLTSLMNEQREKVNKASTNEEESRYSQRTMKDIRDNLDGTTKIYQVFKPWLLTKQDATPSKDGKTINAGIEAGFAKVGALYAQTSGDAIPQPPATWSAETPTATDLATPFGSLYAGVNAAVDPAKDDSIVSQMNDVSKVLGFPVFVEGQ